MTLKVVLFDFNGVIFDDEPIHRQIILEMMSQESLQVSTEDFQQCCLGRSDRYCFQDLLASKGKTLTQSHLNHLLKTKAEIYQNRINALETLPIFPGVKDLLAQLQVADLKLALVSGARRSEIHTVLQATELAGYFSVVVAAEDINASKPDPDGYQLAIQQLNQKYPALQLQPSNCLAIEDSLAGVQAAKQAQVPVVGVAHTHPFHMLQRKANWAVDFLAQLELERIQSVFSGSEEYPPPIPPELPQQVGDERSRTPER